jgi:hypothetical protein
MIAEFIEHFHLLFTMALSPIHSFIHQFTTARTESDQSAISLPVLWYRLPAADVSLLSVSQILPMSQPKQLLNQSEHNWNSAPNLQ